jgi:hypothetical protein
VSKQNLNPPIGAFGALRIVKNRLELRKLQPPKVEAIKNFFKKSPNITKPVL